MKIKNSIIFLSLISAPGLALAQDDPASTDQQAAIREAAVAINSVCPVISSPVMPDGATASQDTMLSSQAALKTYIDDGNEYLGCLEEVEGGWGEDYTETQKAVVNFLYNSMVESLQSSADAFNTQLQIFRARSDD
jgi:hypothetical protein